MAIGIAVTMLLLVKVVPEFESMFQSFGAELPALTQMTVNLSKLAQQYWLTAFGALVAAIFLLKQGIQRSPNIAYRMHALLLRLPIIGDIMHKSAVARFLAHWPPHFLPVSHW